ncbi:hypothetical protein [Shewanella litorisediminis]|uniref:Uncharacterized protein n=1 Tax=Shewanella litorisediminis TaxID=1173586 RepID=A0ABX7G1C4_9GAMM|nr:hypothetical protein [Shewanella litorisediminis]MCL2919064.1 hypothetical protein [Shewanella litorisediminis]QRH01125.1 hypothetical protein JQC75_14850 [Shewanella litorisediminis]
MFPNGLWPSMGVVGDDKPGPVGARYLMAYHIRVQECGRIKGIAEGKMVQKAPDKAGCLTGNQAVTLVEYAVIFSVIQSI